MCPGSHGILVLLESKESSCLAGTNASVGFGVAGHLWPEMSGGLWWLLPDGLCQIQGHGLQTGMQPYDAEKPGHPDGLQVPPPLTQPRRLN